MIRMTFVLSLLCASLTFAQNSMVQMTDTVGVQTGVAITCATQGTFGAATIPVGTTEQSWYRTFDVSGAFPDADNQGITLPIIELTSVTFAVEACEPGTPNGTIPVTIRLYDDPNPDPNLGLTTAILDVPNMTLLHEQVVEVPATAALTKVTVPLVDLNGESTVISYPATGSRLVAGIFIPALNFTTAGNAIFAPGGNGNTESLDTFWASPNCGISVVPGQARPIRIIIGNPTSLHLEVQWQDPNDPNRSVLRNGSGEGLYLRTAINATNLSFFDGLTTGPFENVKDAAPGDLLTVSVGDTFDGTGPIAGTPPALVAQFFATGAIPNTPIAAFPEVHINPAIGGLQVLYDGTTPVAGVGPPVFGLAPFTFTYFIPGGLTGVSAVVQCLAVAPSFSNGFFAASEAHIINFL